ncbi:hypothetical protein BDZ89DRAFT_1073868 [Hymenopellis radicata]|nr:hypothetical protein BDZ89DRAFT_1073868 [Hymenopellis radicata]
MNRPRRILVARRRRVTCAAAVLLVLSVPISTFRGCAVQLHAVWTSRSRLAHTSARIWRLAASSGGDHAGDAALLVDLLIDSYNCDDLVRSRQH